MYNGTLVMPRSYVAMSNDEMMYLEGGRWNVKTTAIKNFFASKAIKFNYWAMLATASEHIIQANAKTAYIKTVRKGSQGVFTIAYGASGPDRDFANLLCRAITLNGWISYN